LFPATERDCRKQPRLSGQGNSYRSQSLKRRRNFHIIFLTPDWLHTYFLTFLTCTYLCGDVSFSYDRSDIYLRNSTIALNTPILPSTVYYESFLYIICVFPSRSQIFAHNLSSHVGIPRRLLNTPSSLRIFSLFWKCRHIF
jgi:hypothetical protein